METAESEGAEPVGVDPEAVIERRWLDETSWVDVARGWARGADLLSAALLDGVAWQSSRLFRYDHWVEERRLAAMWRLGDRPPHPALVEFTRTLQHRYRVRFGGLTMLQYRDGHDGQAFHRDTDMRWLDDTVVAILTLGASRPWLLRPRSSRHRHFESHMTSQDLAPASGDLIVMGGRCQADWEHSVPYRAQDRVGTRLSIQWRHAARHGRPFVGGSYSAPLSYGRAR